MLLVQVQGQHLLRVVCNAQNVGYVIHVLLLLAAADMNCRHGLLQHVGIYVRRVLADDRSSILGLFLFLIYLEV